jgi:hypothetical protein
MAKPNEGDSWALPSLQTFGLTAVFFNFWFFFTQYMIQKFALFSSLCYYIKTDTNQCHYYNQY